MDFNKGKSHTERKAHAEPLYLEVLPDTEETSVSPFYYNPYDTHHSNSTWHVPPAGTAYAETVYLEVLPDPGGISESPIYTNPDDIHQAHFSPSATGERSSVLRPGVKPRIPEKKLGRRTTSKRSGMVRNDSVDEPDGAVSGAINSRHLADVSVTQALSNTTITTKPEPAAKATGAIRTDDAWFGNYKEVVAIDFGTAYTGYAYMHLSEVSSIKTHAALIHSIRENPNWKSATGQFVKCPTSVAVNEDGSFVGFGFTALDRYREGEDVNLFHEFKMQLARPQRLGAEMVLHSACKENRSTKIKALDVFAMALNYIKKRFMDALKNSQGRTVNIGEVFWVITVPAIWNDQQKQFMRQAAVQAGLLVSPTSANLIIALEPECAALYCRSLPNSSFMDGVGDALIRMSVGMAYMVVDAGGGTTDISIHKVKSTSVSEEIFQPSGIPVGGTDINKEFERYMATVIGKNVLNTLKNDTSAQNWLEFVLDFDQKKRMVKEDFSSHIDLTIQMGFAEDFEEITKKKFKAFIKEQCLSELAITKQGKLRLSEDLVKQLMEPIITKICERLAKLLDKPNVKDVSTIFIVGGLGMCAPLQSRIKSLFGKRKKILVPLDANLCVLKGAVLFGRNPDFISQRVSKFTYALLMARDVRKDDDPKRRKTPPRGEPYVETLQVIITRGQPVPLDYTKTMETVAVDSRQNQVQVAIYRSELAEVEDPQAEGVQKLGMIIVDLAGSHQSGNEAKLVTIEMTFGGTEIKVAGITSHKRIETRLEML